MALIKHRPGAIWAIVILILVSAACIWLRTEWSLRGGVASGDSVWKLTLAYDFLSESEGAGLYLALPTNTPNIRVIAEDYFYPNLTQARSRQKTAEGSKAVFFASRKGRSTFRADFKLLLTTRAYGGRAPVKTKLGADLRNRYLGDGPGIETGSESIRNMVQELSEQNREKAKLLEAIVNFCERKIAVASTGAPEDAAGALLKRKATTLGRARLMVAMFRAGKIPARLVAGFILGEKRRARLHYWAEAYFRRAWTPFDPENGHRRELPANFLPMSEGGNGILRVKGVSDLVKRYSITHIVAPNGLLGLRRENPLEIADLTRLPLATQNSLIILLLLPVGALLSTFFRNVIGVTTFGTFTPTLLALAAVYADWRTAVVLFLVVVVIGIGGRSLMPGLKLMRAPRISVVFTLVAFIMTFTLSAMEHFNFVPAGHVVLLPLVVLTTIIDRVYTLADEHGMHTALLRLFWTVAVAITCIIVFKWRPLGRLLLVYPELHFTTLGLMLLFGLYNGRKLLEFPAFHLLTENRKKTKAKPEPEPEPAGDAD